MIDRLSYIAGFIRAKYGVNIWFVEILGKRWSYITGKNYPAIGSLERIKLTERFGMVSDSWERFPAKERKNFITFLQKIVEKYG